MKHSNWETMMCRHGNIIGKARWTWAKGTIENSVPEVEVDMHKCPTCKISCDCIDCVPPE